jgi:N12 class adenine-specific DNA methylase
MLVVPGHCLAQAAREFLALYPGARILVADETSFTKDKRHRFLSRAATATWDAIIITHSAFRFIGVPSAFEQQMIQDELELYEQLLTKVESDDRVSRKRLERLKEGLKERLEALARARTISSPSRRSASTRSSSTRRRSSASSPSPRTCRP